MSRYLYIIALEYFYLNQLLYTALYYEHLDTSVVIKSEVPALIKLYVITS